MSTTTPERPPTDPRRVATWIYLDALTTFLRDLHGYAGPDFEPRLLKCPDYVDSDDDFYMGDVKFEEVVPPETDNENDDSTAIYNQLTTHSDIIVSRIFAALAGAGPEYFARHAAHYAERAELYLARRDGLPEREDEEA